MVEVSVKAAMDDNVAGGKVQAATEPCFLIFAVKHDSDVAAPVAMARNAFVSA